MGSDITKQLCDYLFHERYKGLFIVAHNFRGEFSDNSVMCVCVCVCVCVCAKNISIVCFRFAGFDGYWVADWLLENSILPNTIFSGTRIM
jgi:hypothetical protein